MMFPVMMEPWFVVAGLAAVGLSIWMHLYQRTASRRMPVSSLRLVPETPQVRPVPMRRLWPTGWRRGKRRRW